MTETKAVVLLATPITGPEAKVNRKSAVDILREQVVDLPNLTDRQIGETNRAVEAVAQKYAEKHKSDPPLEEQIEAGIAQMEKEIKKDEENIEKACKKIDNNLLKLKISKDKGEKLPALKDGTDSPQVKNRDSVKNLPLEDKKSGKKEKTPEQKLAEKKENLLLLKVAFTLAQSADSLKHLIGVEPLGRVNINLYKRGLDAVLNSFTTVFQGSKRINPATGVDEIAYFEHDIRTYLAIMSGYLLFICEDEGLIEGETLEFSRYPRLKPWHFNLFSNPA